MDIFEHWAILSPSYFISRKEKGCEKNWYQFLMLRCHVNTMKIIHKNMKRSFIKHVFLNEIIFWGSYFGFVRMNNIWSELHVIVIV